MSHTTFFLEDVQSDLSIYIYFSFLQDSERAGRHHTGPSAKLQVCSAIVGLSQTHFDHKVNPEASGFCITTSVNLTHTTDGAAGFSVSCAAPLTAVKLKIIYGKEL